MEMTEGAVISIPAQEKKQTEPEEIETKGLLPPPYKDGWWRVAWIAPAKKGCCHPQMCG
jgi:hypothetical protein